MLLAMEGAGVIQDPRYWRDWVMTNLDVMGTDDPYTARRPGSTKGKILCGNGTRIMICRTKCRVNDNL